MAHGTSMAFLLFILSRGQLRTHILHQYTWHYSPHFVTTKWDPHIIYGEHSHTQNMPSFGTVLNTERLMVR